MIKVPVYIYETYQPIEGGVLLDDFEIEALRRTGYRSWMIHEPMQAVTHMANDAVEIEIKKITLGLVYNYSQSRPDRILALVEGDLEDFKVFAAKRESERWHNFWTRGR
jgi:hypothetical protein